MEPTDHRTACLLYCHDTLALLNFVSIRFYTVIRNTIRSTVLRPLSAINLMSYQLIFQ